ncbi:MAG: DUF4386 domain-containing protein [Acidimicrobiales bacterium]
MTTTTERTDMPTAPPAAVTASRPERPGPTVTPRKAAKIAGVSYVLLFIAAIFANFFVREGLIDSTDAGATAANITESEGLFRFGLVVFLFIFLLDVLIAWALHIVLREKSHDVSLLAAWLRLMYTVFLGVAAIFFYQGLNLLSGADYLSVTPTDQLQAQALAAFELFNSTWLIGLAAFGLHLMVIGWLFVTTGLAPRALGLVMIAAGAAYVIDTVAYSLLGNYADHKTAFLAMVAIPSIIGEAWFGLWLLLRAGKVPTRS